MVVDVLDEKEKREGSKEEEEENKKEAKSETVRASVAHREERIVAIACFPLTPYAPCPYELVLLSALASPTREDARHRLLR